MRKRWRVGDSLAISINARRLAKFCAMIDSMNSVMQRLKVLHIVSSNLQVSMVVTLIGGITPLTTNFVSLKFGLL